MEHLLPRSTFQPDPGSDFAALLQQVAPASVPAKGIDLPIPHGTTVIAAQCEHAVVLAGDRRATAGYSIASRSIEKIFPADAHSGVAIAGAAGPAVEMVRLFQVQLEHYEKVEGETLSLEGKANQLGQMIRSNLGAAMAGLAVVPIFAGYDLRRDVGRVFSYDITGGRYEEANFTTTGSGSIHARNWLKATWQPSLSSEALVALCIQALFAAADEDVATGGPDLVRGIFPTIAVITRDGYEQWDESRVEIAARTVLGGRSQGGLQ